MDKEYETYEDQEPGIYDKEFIDELRDNDEIDDFEEAFMRGYNEDEEEVVTKKKKIRF